MEENGTSESTPILGRKKKDWLKGLPVRYALAILAFVGFFNVYAMRVNLSVAMVAMVNSSSGYRDHDNSDAYIVCAELLPTVLNESTNTNKASKGQFNWDPTTQAIILGSFFYGYVVTQIPGGVLAEKIGGKWLFGFGVLVTSVFTMLTPLAAHLGVATVITVRVIEGLAEGVTFPAVNCLIGRWAPKMERSRISTIIFTGSPVGNVIAMALSGLLADSSFLGGWPSIFYVFGFVGCIWFFFWAWLIYERPADHPRISKEELMQIQQDQDDRERPKTPWLSILTSVPVWALALTHFGQNWGLYTFMTEMPTYLANILHFDIKKNGVLSALPYLLQAIFAWVASYIADKMRQSERFSITAIRKIINSIAFFGPGICVMCIAFLGCQPVLIVGLLCLAMGLNGFIYSGFNVTHIDMSPDFAGTLMGITNCVANFSGFLAPYVVGLITSEGQTLQNWGLVFAICSAVYFFTGIMYDIFCTAELQPWGLSTSADSSRNEDDIRKPSLKVECEKQQQLRTTDF